MKGIGPLLCPSVRRGIATVLLSFSVAVTASAQATGGIEGSVVDANGNPLPGVVATVIGPGVREERVTDRRLLRSDAVRGFQVIIKEAQIGTTIDGFPNGTSDYWSGSKANRFIDPMNLGGVEVSQGTADIASRSVEALGGTFDYLTDDPAVERIYTASSTPGENEEQRFSMRVDTGPLFGRDTRAWIAAVRQEATDGSRARRGTSPSTSPRSSSRRTDASI